MSQRGCLTPTLSVLRDSAVFYFSTIPASPGVVEAAVGRHDDRLHAGEALQDLQAFLDAQHQNAGAGEIAHFGQNPDRPA